MAGGYISLVVRGNRDVPASEMKISWCCGSKAVVMAPKASPWEARGAGPSDHGDPSQLEGTP